MIIQYPNQDLHRKSRPVELPGDLAKVQELAKEMEPYLTATGGAAGMSAIQLGTPICLIGLRYGMEAMFLVNPEIVWRSGDRTEYREGCISIKYGKEFYLVVRDKMVKVRGLRLNADFMPGAVITLKVRDILGRAVQHEIDHLDGKLIIDHGRAVA